MRYRDNVAISAATRPAQDPTAVLLNSATTRALAGIEKTYAPEIMIFDLPPLLVSDDARAFIKDVDCVPMVAKACTTAISQLDSCEREIAEQTNVLGTALNECRHGDDVHGASYEPYELT